MSYYWFNRKEILQKGKENCFKEKAAEYYFKKKSNKRKVKGAIQKLATR